MSDTQDTNDYGSDPEPAAETEMSPRKPVWIRGLQMLIFAFLFAIAEAILWICAVLQFGWLLFTSEKNDKIARFGESLGLWLQRVVQFQTGASDEKPFPWSDWA